MKIGPIESDVPVTGVNFRNNKYHFEKLEVGQSRSFTFESNSQGISFVRAAYSYAKRHGLKFIVRREGAGYRCWRIA